MKQPDTVAFIASTPTKNCRLTPPAETKRTEMAGAGTSNDLSVNEIISTLRRSSLPTVVVEGSDDIVVHRRLEDRLAHLGVSVFPVGGRDKVISAFDRRGELPAGAKVVFVADQDTWVYSSVPPAYAHPNIVFTAGYSIENDVFVDGNLDAILAAQDERAFRQDLATFVDWYALALTRHLADCRNPIALHPEQVLDPAQLPDLMSLRPGEAFPTTLRDQVHGEYARLLRGKSLR
ncbi:MAG: DUF4435 domain-containing protein [Candidatus Accumulibacter propinquus]|jgi:hypothetical protein|uniref:DUF4435 domain-containing protein n=1 Tax=Candidatus Accumulibacter propinquus TaxID=2954380 RepID=UPI002FC3A309